MITQRKILKIIFLATRKGRNVALETPLLWRGLSLVIWAWGILNVKSMADGFVRVFCGADYVILPIQYHFWALVMGVFALSLYLFDPPFLPPLTRTLRICAEFLVYMWLGLFAISMTGAAWYMACH